jgi:hypothetical protein
MVVESVHVGDDPGAQQQKAILSGSSSWSLVLLVGWQSSLS